MLLSRCSKPARRQAAALLALLVIGGCASGPQPKPGTRAQRQPQAPAQQKAGLSSTQQAAFARGVAALRANNAAQAAQIFDRLAADGPPMAAVFANQGIAHMANGDDKVALTAFEKAVALAPDLADIQVRLGVLYRRAGEFDKAEAAYKAGLAANPDDRYAHLDLGILYDAYLHKPQQALIEYQRFQKLSDKPDDEVALWIAELKQRL